MGACLVLTPLIIASWPAVSAAVTAAAASMGFAMLQGSAKDVVEETGPTQRRVEMGVEDSEILREGHITAEKMVLEKDGVRVTFSRDARGALKVCLEGKAMTDQALKALGEELIGRVTQQYIYHRIVTEMKNRHMAVVSESVAADRTVKIRVRSV